MPPPMMSGMHTEMLTTEILFSLIVVSLCAVIYFQTKEIYSLSKHKGIFHFRNIFLYFGLAYTARLVSFLTMLSTYMDAMMLYHEVTGYSMLLVSYFGTMAILSVAMTVAAYRMKRLDSHIHYLLHGIAIVSSVFVYLTRSYDLLLIVQTLVFLFTILAIFVKSRMGSARGFLSQNLITYLLLFIFWMLSIVAFIRGPGTRYIRFPVYLISACIFVWIFFRVHKRLLANGKKKG